MIVGTVSILLGRPAAAHDLAPLASPADLFTRLAPISPVVAAGVAGAVAAVVAVLLASRRLDPVGAALELLVLGAAIAGAIGGMSGRIGHATDGSVMVATVACLMGAAAVMAGGVISILGHRVGANS